MTNTLQPLKDKVALVVGGSRGIGAGIVRRLAGEGAGIALTYAAAEDKANELLQQVAAGGVRAIAIKADSGNEAELRGAVAKAKQQFGRLDILVVNAGVLIPGGILGSHGSVAADSDDATALPHVGSRSLDGDDDSAHIDGQHAVEVLHAVFPDSRVRASTR